MAVARICRSKNEAENLALLLEHYVPEATEPIALKVDEIEWLSRSCPMLITPTGYAVLREYIKGYTMKEVFQNLKCSQGLVEANIRRICGHLATLIMPWDKIPVNYVFRPYIARQMRDNGFNYFGQFDGMSRSQIATRLAPSRYSKFEKAREVHDSVLLHQNMRDELHNYRQIAAKAAEQKGKLNRCTTK